MSGEDPAPPPPPGPAPPTARDTAAPPSAGPAPPTARDTAAPPSARAASPPPAGDADWRQLDIRVLAVHVARVMGSLAPIVLLLLLGGSLDRTVVIPLAFVFGGGALRALNDAVTWATTHYRVGEELVELRSGLLRRSALSVPRDRVRTVNLTAKPLHRAFGIATVEIGTGTHEQGQLRLDAVAAGEGRRLRAELLRRETSTAIEPPRPTAPGGAGLPGEAGRAVNPGAEDSLAPAAAVAAPQPDSPPAEAPPFDEPAETVIARLRWRWLPYHLLSPWTLLLPVAAFGALFNLLDQIGLEQRFSRLVGRAAEDGIHRADTEPWWAAALLLLLALVLLLLLGAIGASLQFGESWWRFRLTREASGTLHLRRGLLTSRSVTIEQRRLRGVTLSEPLLQRAVGGAGLRAVVSGLHGGGRDRREGGADTLLPNVPRAEAESIAAEVMQEQHPFGLLAELVPHPRAALRRRLTRSSAAAAVPLGALLLTGPVAGWLPGWVWLPALVLVPLFLLLGRDAYRALGHRLAGGYLVTRHGVLSRHTTALRRDGVIGWNVRRSPFQRRAGLVTLTATTAAGRGGFEVVDVGEAAGLAFAEEAVPGLLAPFLSPAADGPPAGDALAPAADASTRAR